MYDGARTIQYSQAVEDTGDTYMGTKNMEKTYHIIIH